MTTAEPTPRVIDYFNNEFPSALKQEQPILLQRDAATPILVIRKLYLDSNSNAKWAGYYFQDGEHVAEICRVMAQLPHLALELQQSVVVEMGTAYSPHRQTSESLVFTNKVLIYIEKLLTAEERQAIVESGRSVGMAVEVRDKGYVALQNMKPQAFISHDSRNQSMIARPLAVALSRRLCPIWYSEFSLKVGDRLRESIEKGLKECKKCVLVLTKQFLTNPGWTKTEFNSIFTREMLENKKLLIPVWYRVTKQEVFDYCPSLPDVLAYRWKNKNSVEEAATFIKAAIDAA